MPLVSDNFGPIYQSVILDASGNGAVSFQAVGSNIRITNVFFRVASQTLQAVCRIYKGQIADGNVVFLSNSGSTGANVQGNIDLFDGETCYVRWTGGDVGAVATATFTGGHIPLNEVGPSNLNAESPIAAGDGSLIYPALRSPNFVTGTSGWSLDRNGNVEVNDATIRGDLTATGVLGAYISVQGDYSVTGDPAIVLEPGQANEAPGYIYVDENAGTATSVLGINSPNYDTANASGISSIQLFSGGSGSAPSAIYMNTDEVHVIGNLDIFGNLTVSGTFSRYGCLVSCGTPTLANNTVTTNTSLTALQDTYSMLSGATTITVPVAGVYEVGVIYRYASQATAAGLRQVRINVNGTEHMQLNTYAVGLNAINIPVLLVEQIELAVSDEITFGGFQNSGGNLALTGNSRAWVRLIEG